MSDVAAIEQLVEKTKLLKKEISKVIVGQADAVNFVLLSVFCGGHSLIIFSSFFPFYVNGINTKKGGKHVDYIMNQIVKKMAIYIEKKKKIRVKPITIKEQLMLFLNCIIENPAFDSQTKETMK